MNSKPILFALLVTFSMMSYACSGKDRKNSEELAKNLENIIQSHSLILITSFDNSKALDVYEGSQENNARVVIYDFNADGN